MGKDFLYHYTNLFAFASIIKNRSIRFSPLSKMDDINDGQSKDFETISQYVFASSWTYSNEESIPFWAMYTNDMHGVRIGLPKNPFKKYTWKEDPYHNSNFDKENTFPISEKKAKGENYFISPFYEEFFSVKVNYSDDEDKLNPCIKEKDQVYLQNIGTYKNTAWEFQAEWRYKLVCFPEPYEKVGNANTCFLMEQGVLLPVTSIDLKIDDAYFEQMEILTGPKMTGEERHFLDFLIDEYGASIKNPVHSSQLKIR